MTTGSQPNPRADDSMVGPHGTAEDHGETHGHDDHAHGADALGPVDVQAWGALALGVAAGLLIVLCLVLTTSVLA